MFRTAQHPRLEQAVASAETLHRLRVKPTSSGKVMLWIFRHEWKPLHLFADTEAAESYLLNKLDPIPSTPGDINRRPPPQTPEVIWGPC